MSSFQFLTCLSLQHPPQADRVSVPILVLQDDLSLVTFRCFACDLFRGFLLFEPLLPLRVEADIPLTKGLGHHNTGHRYCRTHFPACERILLSITSKLSVSTGSIIVGRLARPSVPLATAACGNLSLLSFGCMVLFQSKSCHVISLCCALFTCPLDQTRKSENVAQGIHSCNIFMQDCWSGVRCGLSGPMCPSSRPA